MEGKLVKLAALEAAFDHFTNEHWVPLQAIIISLHDFLCWTCRGDGEPIPDQLHSSLAPPTLSVAIPIPAPRLGRRPGTPSPPPLSPISSDESSLIPDSSSDSSPNPYLVKHQMFQAAQGGTCMDRQREGSNASLPLLLRGRRGSQCPYSGGWRGR